MFEQPFKLCKDCVHYDDSSKDATRSPSLYAQCRATRKPNPVTGTEETEYCRSARIWTTQCGPDAKWFVVRHQAEEAA